MPRLDTFSTAGLGPRRRLEFWNDVTCDTFSPNVADPLDIRSFEPRLSRSSVGDVLLGEVISSPSEVHHAREHVARTRRAMFYLHLQIEGRSTNRQDGREACLEAGDFTLLDNTRPYELAFAERNTVLVVGVPDHVMRRHLAHPERAVALPMRLRDGAVAGLLSDFLQRLWQLCSTSDGPVDPSVSGALLSLIGGAYASMPEARADATALPECRRLRIVSYIEEHLGDADLGPAKIAAAFRTTPRNLHLMFSGGGETMCRYILRRRLEECARVLADRSQVRRSISDIAFDLGFSSLTHFGKVFHEQYGMTAREYRQQQLCAGPGEEPLAGTLGSACLAC
ncbi:MAG: helix-turn-helix domain-containing protein [Steroidobacteraceae bacterium]